jgi:hypothetical protein
MARLPEIDEGPVQESSGALAQVQSSVQGLGQTLERGFHLYGAELIKSQNARASADLLGGLEDVGLELRAKKTLSTQELRDYLGADYDALPPAVKEQTIKRVLNPQNGEVETQDRDDVPMFAVAGHIFDAKSKELLANSVAGFSSPGWAAEFQDHAAHEILQQKMLLSRHQLYDMHDYLQERDTVSAVDLANAGHPGEARTLINGSQTMDLKHKTDLLSHIDKIEQTRPLYESLRTGDIGTMAKQLVALGDEKQFTKLSPDERNSFTSRLEAEIKSFQDGMRKAGDEQLKANAEQGWNGILSKERDGQSVSYRDIPMPGTVHADSQKAMIEYVDKLNKGEKPETEWGLYASLIEKARVDRQGFQKANLLNYRNRLADSEFKQLLEMQQGMRGGNPDKYDHFISTDEAINYRLSGAPYNINVKDKAEMVGYIKTQVSQALNREQQARGGKDLGLDDRDRIIDETLRKNIDPRKNTWTGMLPVFGDNHPSESPAHEAGIPASVATTFQRAVTALEPKVMTGTSVQRRQDTLKKQYEDYSYYEPMIETAWQRQSGRNISPEDALQVWYHLKSNWSRFEGDLRTAGGWTDVEKLRQQRMTESAVHEALKRVQGGR